MIGGAAVNRLKEDAEIMSLLKATETDSRIYPHASDDFEPCIIYSTNPIEGGTVKKSSLELKINYTAKSEQVALQIYQRLYELFDFTDKFYQGWVFENVHILAIEVTGGGSIDLIDYQQKALIFGVTWRKI